MRRTLAAIAGAVGLVALILVGQNSSIQAAANVTAVCGSITSSTTWTVISSPYEVCFGGVTVGPTATLTIQPGVTVQFQPSVNAKLYVQGALSAIGAVTQPITFTGVVATPGSWGGLSADYSVITPAIVSLKYVTLEDGGGGSSAGQVYADRAVVTMTHSLVRNGNSNGLHFTFQAVGFNVQTTQFRQQHPQRHSDRCPTDRSLAERSQRDEQWHERRAHLQCIDVCSRSAALEQSGHSLFYRRPDQQPGGR